MSSLRHHTRCSFAGAVNSVKTLNMAAKTFAVVNASWCFEAKQHQQAVAKSCCQHSCAHYKPDFQVKICTDKDKDKCSTCGQGS